MSKLQKLVLANSDLLNLCKHLRRSLWLKLLPDTNHHLKPANDFQNYISSNNFSLVSQSDRQQIWYDIKRCQNINPHIYKHDLAKRRLYKLLIDFLAIDPSIVYIQGMDSIAATLFSEFYDRDHLVGPLLKQIYQKYLVKFVNEERQLTF